MKAFDWMLGRRGLVWCAAIAFALGGALVARRLPSGIYPEVEFPRIVVVARAGDAPPDVTQVSVTRPLEAALATVLGVERIRSKTIRGSTEMSLQFAPGTDMWRALQLVESRVGEVRSTLLAGAEVTVERLTTTSFPVLTYNLTGPVDPRRLRELGEFVLKPAFSRVRGVGRVEVLGGDVREVEVILDPERTAALHVSPAQVAEKLRAQTVLQAVGRLEQAHSLVTVMASGEPAGLEDLRAVPVAMGAEGSPILLGAIAEVREGAEDRLLRVSGPGGETVLLSIARLPGASTPEVVANVKAAAREISGSLPKGVELTPVYDQAELVNESIRSVRDAILIGIVLCVGVIALFLRDLRAGLAAAVSVPLTLGATFLPIGLLGHSLNLMSLGGLAVAIGLVIDDAIVVVEAIGRRVEEGLDPKSAARDGVRALLAALVGTTLTTVVVFLPLAWLEGVVGRFFSALAVTLSTAVLLSLAFALTVVPLAAAGWMRPRKGSRPTARYADTYERAVRPFLRRPWIGLGVALGLFALGVVAALEAPSGFLPTMDEGAFVLDYFLPAGTSLTETDAIARKIEAILSSTPEVQTYSRRTGAELGPVAATQVNRGDIMVRLKASSQRQRSADEVIAEVRAKVIKDVPEARTEFIQVLQDVLNDLAGTPRPIEIKLFGDDYTTLRAKAKEIVGRIHDVPGLVDLYPGFEEQAPELRFRIDGSAAARAGKSAADVATDLDDSLHGVVASVLRRPDRPIGVRVRYPDSVRFDAQQVVQLPLLVGTEVVTRVSAVAQPIQASSETLLLRESLRPAVILTADHEGRDLGSVMRDVQSQLRGLSLPEGYRLEFGGQYEGQQGTLRDLSTVMGFGLLAVLVVLLAQFRRARLAPVVLVAVPLAVVGALTTLWLTQIPLNASSLMGCVLLVGLVVKNGILLLEQYERLLEDGKDVEQALVEAGRIRVRPILMTTLATVAGLAPLAFSLGSGAEIQRPLAVAVIGGLLVSTAISLLVLPSLVRLVFPRHARAPVGEHS
ncbi:MAG TPA: efflux RND transporter permease subunit [Polyangia bacterium]|nr:efflux RND transporter permease subunit [Polyangia bacterium]